MEPKYAPEEMLTRFDHSKFRSSFHLRKEEKEYAKAKGYLKIKEHAYDLIRKAFSTSKSMQRRKANS